MTSGAGAARLEPHRRTRWLLRAPAADGQARLFCFPYSGTGASMYRGWPRWIGGTEVCPLQPPGRENRIGEPHYGTYQNLADSLAEELLPYLDRPFAFIGHCGGSLPGVETTMRLDERGLPTPTRVFISSEVAPQDGPSGRFLWLTDAELVHELELLARRMGSQPDPSLIDLGLEIIQQDVAANRRYHYPEPPRLPAGITVIGWSDDAEIAPALMGGWELCAADVRYVTLDGGHHAYMSAPRSLLDEIAHDMDRAIRDALA